MTIEESGRRFRPIREYYVWAAEWQRATGKLLASKERTREAGLKKLKDAERRFQEIDDWTSGVRE